MFLFVCSFAGVRGAIAASACHPLRASGEYFACLVLNTCNYIPGMVVNMLKRSMYTQTYLYLQCIPDIYCRYY